MNAGGIRQPAHRQAGVAAAVDLVIEAHRGVDHAAVIDRPIARDLRLAVGRHFGRLLK